MSKDLALVGAGKSGETFVEWSGCTDFALFTTEGHGHIGDVIASPLSQLNPDTYEKIIVASQYVDEIARDLLANGVSENRIHWFDFLQKKTIPLKSMGFKAEASDDVLYAIYDLEVYPANFDLGIYLARADAYRQLKNLSAMTLVLVSGSFNGVNARSVLSQGRDMIDWRVQHILRELPQLVPACGSVIHIERNEVFDSLMKNVAFTYPSERQKRPTSQDFAFGQLVEYWKQGANVKPYTAPVVAKDFVQQFFKTNKINRAPVTLTLRESQYQESRNSGLTLYQDIANLALEKGVPVILVRDTDMAFTAPLSWNGCLEFPVAAFDQAIRMALYEMSFFNVSVSSGPSWSMMALSQNVDFLLTHPADDNFRNSSYEHLANVQGIRKNEQYPFHSDFQRMCWAIKDEDVLAEFETLIMKKLVLEN